MWDSQVKGCQLEECMAVKAHLTPGQVNPARTTGLAVTYMSSSKVMKPWSLTWI